VYDRLRGSFFAEKDGYFKRFLVPAAQLLQHFLYVKIAPFPVCLPFRIMP
jgi:hypothetical protein